MRCLERGVSLFEVLLVLLCGMIVVAFGLPLTTHWYQQQQVAVMVSDIQQALHQAATEAMTRGEIMRLMPCSHCRSWSQGMMLIAERDVNHPHATESRYEWRWPTATCTVSWHGFISNDFLRFSPDLDHAALNGYFLIQSDQQNEIKLVVNRLGNVRIETLTS
jgi:Tfp pilus assembly protein FimT